MARKREIDTRPDAADVQAFIKQRMGDLGLSAGDLEGLTGINKSTLQSSLAGYSDIRNHAPLIASHIGYDTVQELYRRVRAEHTGELPGIDDCLPYGLTRTFWFNAHGNGQPDTFMRASDFRLRVDLSDTARLHLDDELVAAVDETKALAGAGTVKFTNGKTFFMRQADWVTPKGDDERIVLDATLVPHEYALFFTLTRTEHGRTLLKQRMMDWRKNRPVIAELSGGFGIGVAIVSSDDKFILGRRQQTQGPRPEELDVGAVEGFSLVHDQGFDGKPLSTGSELDVSFAARRALREEYGILDADIEDLTFLGFGYDLEYGQWNIKALARVKRNAEKIERRRKGALHQEFLETIRVTCTPKDVFSAIAADKKQVWSFGVALAHDAMVALHGVDKAERAADAIDMRPIRRAPT